MMKKTSEPNIHADGNRLERGKQWKQSMWMLAWLRFKRNRTGMIGLVLVLIVCFIALLSPFIAPYHPNDQSAMLEFRSNSPPCWKNPLGTDRMGYDIASRVIYGAPTALAVGIISMLVASFIGIILGGVSGYSGGMSDELLMRFTEFFLVVPVFIVILVMVRIFGIFVIGTSIENLPFLHLSVIILILGIFSWPPIARVARADFVRLKELEFVEAARCIGAGRASILFKHILPNAFPSVLVLIALGIGNSILMEAMISFLGFGDPKAISWGQLLYFNYEYLKIAPWSSIAPGAAIFMTVLGFNFLADGLADAFNPRLKE